MKLTYYVLVGLFMIACAPAVDMEQEARELMQVDEEFASMAVEKGAAEAFRYFFEPEGIQFPNGFRPVKGREAVYQSLIDVPPDYELRWKPELAEVSQAGDFGGAWGYFTSSYSDSTEREIKNYGKYLTIWRKQPDGTWRVRADIGNKNPAPDIED